MKTLQTLPTQIHSTYPPFIANAFDGTYCIVDGKWIPIDPNTTLQQIRERWIKLDLFPQQEKIVQETKEFVVKSSDGKKNYIVTAKASSITCTCTGFGYRNRCKHKKSSAMLL